MKLLKKLVSKSVSLPILILMQLFLIYIAIYYLSSEIPIIFIGISAIAIILSIYIINLPSNPSYKLSWIFLILAFPLIGVVTYLMFGGRKVPSALRKTVNDLSIDDIPLLHQDTLVSDLLNHSSLSAYKQYTYLYKAAEYPIYQNSKVTYFSSGEAKYKDLKQALLSAQHFIFLEYFIVKEGMMLDEIKSILFKKAEEGVIIKLLFDDFGVMHLPKDFRKEMRSHNIGCEFFNPLRPILAIYMNNRDHRKIAVIDGKVGYIGGINIADEYINRIVRFGYWKDTAIKIEGEAVYSLTVMFLHIYNYVSKETNVFTDYKVDNPIYHNEGFIQMFSDSPTDEELTSENAHLNLINSAQRYLYIMTPYLIIGHELITALTLSAKSGVDVRIMVPHIPDKKYVFAVTRSNYEILTKNGVKIYEYTPGFVHAKMMIVDDEIAIVGTSNLDFRSYYMHFECGALIVQSPSIKVMLDDFNDTLKQCQEITYADTLKDPFPIRLYRALLNVFSSVL